MPLRVRFQALGPVDTNAILIDDGHESVLVDAPFDVKKWLDSLEDVPPIKTLLLTHGHWDHIAEGSSLQRSLHIPILVHKEEAPYLKDPAKSRLPLPPIEGIEPDELLEDGQMLTLLGQTVQVIWTPGHSPGCVCFYWPKSQILCSGDTLFRGTIGNVSFATSVPKLMWSSLKKLEALPDETRVIPGHGPETTIKRERSWLPNAQELFG